MVSSILTYKNVCDLAFWQPGCVQFALDNMCVCIGCNASCDTACVQVKSVHLPTAKVQNSHHYTEELCCFQPKLSFSRFHLNMDLYPEDGEPVSTCCPECLTGIFFVFSFLEKTILCLLVFVFKHKRHARWSRPSTPLSTPARWHYIYL